MMAIINNIICSDCGDELEIKEVTIVYGDETDIKIHPCEYCTKETKKEEYERGYDDGWKSRGHDG